MSHMAESSGKLCLSSQELDGIEVHEKAWHMASLPAGPFAHLGSGAIFCLAGNPAKAYVSRDAGATCCERELFPPGSPWTPGPTGALLVSDRGTVVLGFSNIAEKVWTWSDELKDAPDAILPTYVMRSQDGGETWENIQKLHDDWTGATRDMIQTRDGTLVLSTMKMRHDPGRHTVMSYVSTDDGVTWEPSNVIDLGGNGHHGGLTEGTIVELSDSRILQYIRTNWGQFWRATSVDSGRTWHPYGPSGVPASSAPAMLRRLASGRIVLLWNRPCPEGQDKYLPQGGDGIWSATPASNFREELSISFSEDECEHWSAPIVIARNAGGEVSYPYAFEPEPGVLWVTAHRWNLRMGLREEDFSG